MSDSPRMILRAVKHQGEAGPPTHHLDIRTHDPCQEVASAFAQLLHKLVAEGRVRVAGRI